VVGDLDGVGDADTRRGSASVWPWRRSALQQRSTDTTLAAIRPRLSQSAFLRERLLQAWTSNPPSKDG